MSGLSCSVRAAMAAVSVFAASEAMAVALCPDFGSPKAYSAGTIPQALVAADFNRDGRPDVAVANRSSADISVLLRNGAGGFDTAVPYGAGSLPNAIVAADFNRDGNVDLVVANRESSNVSIFLGSANGSFAAAVNASTGAASVPVSLGVADFNRDGKLDVAVADSATDGVAILLGDGLGGLTLDATYPAAAGLIAIAVADFNGDGKADVAASCTKTPGISILNGVGNGTLNAPVVFVALNLGIAQIIASDFDGDGKTDLAAATGVGGNNDVGVALGNGDGTFGAALFYPAGTAPQALATADFDGDGLLDLAVTNTTVISVMAGIGSGKFGDPLLYSAGTTRAWIGVADWNGDGRIDLGVANSGSDDVSTLLNLSQCSTNCGRFAGAATTIPTASQPYTAATADFNHDGNIDVAVGTATAISILRGDGTGGFSSGGTLTTGAFPASIAIGDFNRDGNLDLAVVTFSVMELKIFLGDSTGAFTDTSTYPLGSQVSAVAAGDFDRDGIDDLVIGSAQNANLSIRRGVGDGTFGLPAVFASSVKSFGIAIADFNGDGKLDVASGNNISTNVAVSLGNGDGTFAAKVSYTVGNSPVKVVAADFNGDGKMDLAVGNFLSNNVSILIGVGNGTFLPAVNYGVGAGPFGLVAVDVDGDGKVDLAATNRASNDISVMRGFGDGTMLGAVRYPVGTNPNAIVAADFNRDGRPELLTANNGSSNVSTLPNDCPGFVDLEIRKTHVDSQFRQGDTGRIYTITLSNLGGPATSSTVSVQDVLPAGLALASMAGTGWDCPPATLSCSRNDALEGASSYPPITVTVDVSPTAPSVVTNEAYISAGADFVNLSNNTTSDPANVIPPIPPATTNVVAEAISATEVTISWTAVPVTQTYFVQRSPDNSAWTNAGTATPPDTSFTDSGLTADTGYVYRVFVFNAGGLSAASNLDVATTTLFLDTLGTTTLIQFDHLSRLQTAVNALHRAAGLGDATFTDTGALNQTIKLIHLSELRSNLEAARSAVAGLPPIGYAHPTVAIGSKIFGTDFQEIRNGVK